MKHMRRVSSSEEQDSVEKASGGDSLAVAPDGCEFTVLTQHGLLQLWKAGGAGGYAPIEIPIDFGELTGVQYGFGGKALVLARQDGVVSLYERATCQVWQTFEGHKAPVVKALWRPGLHSRYVASASSDGDIVVWNSAYDDCLFHRQLPHVRTLAWSPDGQKLAAVSVQQLVMWDVVTGDEISLEVPKQASDIAYSPDGNCLCVACMDGCIGFDMGTGQRTYYRQSVGTVARRLAYSPDGAYLVASSHLSLSIWDVETTERVGHVLLSSSARTLAWIEARKLATHDMRGTVSVVPLTNLVRQTHRVKPFAPLTE
jgi:WD40 repeat protein